MHATFDFVAAWDFWFFEVSKQSMMAQPNDGDSRATHDRVVNKGKKLFREVCCRCFRNAWKIGTE